MPFAAFELQALAIFGPPLLLIGCAISLYLIRNTGASRQMR